MRDSMHSTLGDLFRILADSALWRLPDERWNEIDRLLARCEEHVLDRNAAQLRAAVDDLILAAPDRVSKRISAAEQAPVRVRERIGVLIHAIDAPTAADPGNGVAKPPSEPAHRDR